jgi:hypothetical protein
MIVTLLMGFLADLVFDSAASMRRSYRADVDRYFARRGVRSDPPGPTPAR